MVPGGWLPVPVLHRADPAATGRRADHHAAARCRRAAVRDAASTVSTAARELHLSWSAVIHAFRTTARELTEAPLPEVKVLRMDETWRGWPRLDQGSATGKWMLTRDRWHTGFVNALGVGEPARPGQGPAPSPMYSPGSPPPHWPGEIASSTWPSTCPPATAPPSAPASRNTSPSWSITSTSSSSPTRCCPRSGAASPPRPAAGADAPVTRSGKPDGACYAIKDPLLTASIAKENLRNILARPHRRRPPSSRPCSPEVPHLVRGLRHPRG